MVNYREKANRDGDKNLLPEFYFKTNFTEVLLSLNPALNSQNGFL